MRLKSPHIFRPTDVCFLFAGEYFVLALSLTLMLRPTVSRPVCLGIKHPSGAYDQIFFFVRNTPDSHVLDSVGRPLWQEGGSVFCMCRWPLPAQSFSVLIPWDLRPHFTVSDLRLPFSSPPTIRRVTVEVFDPASTRVSPVLAHASCLILVKLRGARKKTLFLYVSISNNFWGINLLVSRNKLVKNSRRTMITL
jgi:hypothetical protein